MLFLKMTFFIFMALFLPAKSFRSQLQSPRVIQVINPRQHSPLPKILVGERSSDVTLRMGALGDLLINPIKAAYTNRKNQIKVLQGQIASAGQSGLIAYGLLNLSYYTIATSIAWYYTANKFVGERLLTRAAKTSSMVWVGSQATKIFRLTGAVLLAPLADKLLDSFQRRFHIQSRDRAFWLMTSLILSTCLLFYATLLIGTSIVTRAQF